MIQTERQGYWHLFWVSLPFMLASGAYVTGILVTEEVFGDRIYAIPAPIGSVFGLAVAVFLGFRMNAAYDRWWESRKILGELTNETRAFVQKLAVYSNPRNLVAQDPATIREQTTDAIDLTIFYVRQLGRELHGEFHTPPASGEAALLARDGVALAHKRTQETLLALGRSLEDRFAASRSLEKIDVLQHLDRFYAVQGRAERIRSTPFPKIYAAFTRMTVGGYVLLLPFIIGDIDPGGENSWIELLAIPLMTVVSTAFLTIDHLANLYGEPFTAHPTSVPIDRICERLVENCREVRRKLAPEKSRTTSLS